MKLFRIAVLATTAFAQFGELVTEEVSEAETQPVQTEPVVAVQEAIVNEEDQIVASDDDWVYEEFLNPYVNPHNSTVREYQNYAFQQGARSYSYAKKHPSQVILILVVSFACFSCLLWNFLGGLLVGGTKLFAAWLEWEAH